MVSTGTTISIIGAFFLCILFGFMIQSCNKSSNSDNSSNIEQVTGNVVGNTAPQGSGSPPPGGTTYLNGTTDDSNSYDDGEPEEVPFEPDRGYTTVNCNEYNCEPPSECYQGQCKTPECVTDADCEDDDPCTPTICSYAGHVNAFCAGPIKELKNNDGCCPLGAWVDKDTDCRPVCGNQKCEFGETTEMCEIDCKDAGPGPAPAPTPATYSPEAN